MDRETQLRHLEEAERNVLEGNLRIVQQRQRIEELERDGHDSSQARGVLKILLETQATMNRPLLEFAENYVTKADVLFG
jgi:hypothetical protein